MARCLRLIFDRSVCTRLGLPSNMALPSCYAPQSFQEELLALCGRGHDLRDVYRAIEAVYAGAASYFGTILLLLESYALFLPCRAKL